MNIKLIVFSLLGGLALFLFGMKVLSTGLQMAFGNKIKILMEKLTDNKLAGVGIGALVTAIIQSSSITTVTLVGLINAGLITLAQSIPMIMGANIGTTVTAQLIAFKVGKYSLPIIAIGFVLYSLERYRIPFLEKYLAKKDEGNSNKDMDRNRGKNNTLKYVGQIILGFGILFLGMTLMSSESKQLVENPGVVKFLAEMGKVPILGIIAGALFTSIIQSSSATSGLVISMGMGAKNLISLKSAVTIIMGANLGTCITVILASIGSTLSSRRAALSHVLFNVIGILLFVPFIGLFVGLIQKTSPDMARQIANAHLCFNIITTLVLLPLSGVLLFVVKKLMPGEDVRVESGAKYLDDLTLETPAVALSMAEKETVRMAKITLTMIEASRMALFEKSKKHIEIVTGKEKVVDELDDKIEVFLKKIDNEALSDRQKTNLAILNHIISDIERIADHANNMCELAERRMSDKIRFSDEAFAELKDVFDKADESVELSITAITKYDEKSINRIMEIEKDVDTMVEQMEENHFERLAQELCSAEAGPLYVDVLRNLERITDHTHNIACARSFGF
ncbi:MAG: Na/Pi cotransporter family protein [Candidatus Eremiobacteraeota bacterium]|nr:Na/Pi cotransporter family protein [Candidatus Eremiobacteraeota bacterium]